MKEQNEESPKEAQKRYITLTDLMVVAWKDKFLIAFFSITFFFSSIYYSLSLPDSWTSTSVVIEAQRESGGGLSGGAMSGLVGLAGIAIDTSSSGTDIALATINSRKFMRNFVINRALKDVTGTFEEFNDYPEGMLKEFGNCKKQFCASLQSACTIAENSESVRKSNLTAKSSFVLAYRALVALYKTQNQIHPAPQAKILRICTSTCKILLAPQAKIFADLHFSNAKSYRESAY
mgnify:CR=1 FL=1